METIFMNTLSSKINEPHKFLNHTNHKKKKKEMNQINTNVSERLDLRGSNKHIAFQNLSI